MKKIIVGAVLLGFTAAAFAACPPHLPYRCAIWGGKTICGCGL